MLVKSTDTKQALGFSWRAFLHTWSLKSPTRTTYWLVNSLVFNLSRSPLFVSSLFCLKTSVLALEPYLVCIGFLWWLLITKIISQQFESNEVSWFSSECLSMGNCNLIFHLWDRGRICFLILLFPCVIFFHHSCEKALFFPPSPVEIHGLMLGMPQLLGSNTVTWKSGQWLVPREEKS